MKADNLMKWDAVDLARILATRYVDSDDLAEAFPSVRIVDSFDSSILPDFIEKNWWYLLSLFEIEDIENWLEEKEYEEEWERWREEEAEYEFEYAEWRRQEYCWRIIEIADMFRNEEPAEQFGPPPKKKSS